MRLDIIICELTHSLNHFPCKRTTSTGTAAAAAAAAADDDDDDAFAPASLLLFTTRLHAHIAEMLQHVLCPLLG